MALPLVFGIFLVTGVACFLTHRATKVASGFTHGHNVNSRPPAPATSSNNLNRDPPAAPATSSNNLNQRPPAAPATSSDNLNRWTLALATSSYNLNRSPPAPATSSTNDRSPAAPATFSTNDRSPAAPATSPDNLNRMPPAPATLSDNLNPRPSAPASSSDNDLNRWSPAAPATSPDILNRLSAPSTSPDNLNCLPPTPATLSDNLNPRPLAPAISPDNLIRLPPAPAMYSDNDLNCRSPAAPATSSEILNLPAAPATLSDNLNPRPAISSNNPVMHVGDMAVAKYEVCPLVHSTGVGDRAVAKYEVCPLVHSTGAVWPLEVQLQTNIVEEVKINELSNGLVEGLENNEVFKGCLGDGLGSMTTVVDLELDGTIDLITPLIEETVVDLELDGNIDLTTPLIKEADDFKPEEEAVNLSGGVIGSREGWWAAARKRVEEWFHWVKGMVKSQAKWVIDEADVVKHEEEAANMREWVIDEADVVKHEEEVANMRGSVIGSGEGWWVAKKRWVEERFRWVKGKLKPWAELLYLDVGMRLTLRRLVWAGVDSVVESKYVLGRYRGNLVCTVLLKMYRILIYELRCRW